MNLTEVFSQVDKNQDYIVDLLQKILAVDTSIPPGGNYGRLLDIVEPEFKKYGFNTQRVFVPMEKYKSISESLEGDRANLAASLDNGLPPASVYAHMDVVPPGDEPWKYDPFGGQIVDGRIYGRGAIDMKGSIACLLGALKIMSEMGIEHRYSLSCLLCTDEEVGVYPGARYLAEEGYFSNHLVWLEFGFVDPVIVVGTAGSMNVTLTGVGKSCHSGVNFMGINAVEQLVPIMNELMVLKQEVEKRTSRIKAFPMPNAPSDMMTPMFNLNVIRGGSKDNIVPGECTLVVNRRYIPDENYDDVLTEIEAALKKGREKTRLLDLKYSAVNLFPPVEMDPDCPASIRAREAKKAVYGYKDFIFGGASASTDMGFVIEALKPQKVEVAAFAPIRSTNLIAHMANEHVYIEDLISSTKELIYYFGY